MGVMPGDFYVRTSGDIRSYRVKVALEIADLVVLEAADGTKISTTFHDFATLFTKRRTLVEA